MKSINNGNDDDVHKDMACLILDNIKHKDKSARERYAGYLERYGENEVIDFLDKKQDKDDALEQFFNKIQCNKKIDKVKLLIDAHGDREGKQYIDSNYVERVLKKFQQILEKNKNMKIYIINVSCYKSGNHDRTDSEIASNKRATSLKEKICNYLGGVGNSKTGKSRVFYAETKDKTNPVMDTYQNGRINHFIGRKNKEKQEKYEKAFEYYRIINGKLEKFNSPLPQAAKNFDFWQNDNINFRTAVLPSKDMHIDFSDDQQYDFIKDSIADNDYFNSFYNDLDDINHCDDIDNDNKVIQREDFDNYNNFDYKQYITNTEEGIDEIYEHDNDGKYDDNDNNFDYKQYITNTEEEIDERSSNNNKAGFNKTCIKNNIRGNKYK